MLVVGFPAGSFATNCYAVATGPGRECLVVDPGVDAAGPLAGLLREHDLRPVAVLLTHGHLDHTASVLPVCGAHDIPAYIHPDDRGQLSDPLSGLPADWAAALASVGLPTTEPDEVRELADGERLVLAGLELDVAHAPGHSPGSVTLLSRIESAPVLFAGDLLFTGSIGRTDLPGGDPDAMNASLARVCLPLPDDTVVRPGHGPATTIGRERTHNPYLRGLAA